MSDKVFYEKIINPFKASIYKGSRKYQVYFQIVIEQLGDNPYPHFSISGVHAPLKNGNCLGGCGQIIDNWYPCDVSYNKMWDVALYKRLIALWKTYHLRNIEIGSDLHKQLLEEVAKFPATLKNPHGFKKKGGGRVKKNFLDSFSFMYYNILKFIGGYNNERSL